MQYDKNIFISEGTALEYFLLHSDGEHRARQLDVTLELYEDKELAKKWYDELYVKLLDKNGKAAARLKEFYENMIRIYPEDD